MINYERSLGVWMNTELAQPKFHDALSLIIGNERQCSGIGTLRERSLHAVLKHTYEPDVSRHEIKIGNYFADIANEIGLIEIQTGNFNVLRRKLPVFLAERIVKIVYPIAQRKWLIWVDEETGEITKKRKSPKTGRTYDAFYELYKIKPMLTHPNLRLDIVLLDITEYRKLDGWSPDRKKGSSRTERIPETLVDIVSINSPQEYKKLIPRSLTGDFLAKDFAKASSLTRRNAQTALNVLSFVGVVSRTGKKGNAIVYRIVSSKVMNEQE
jgi:hypothetical protein